MVMKTLREYREAAIFTFIVLNVVALVVMPFEVHEIGWFEFLKTWTAVNLAGGIGGNLLGFLTILYLNRTWGK